MRYGLTGAGPAPDQHRRMGDEALPDVSEPPQAPTRHPAPDATTKAAFDDLVDVVATDMDWPNQRSVKSRLSVLSFGAVG